ncbi:hypothetical protein LCGC14_1254990 [marine sediment metagenome]|uniref:Uncharacterized protein n=1 Tax=marine sediment metagenome TaxID=412755 RepID=A0A0F9LNN7_9ZZZZ
MSTLNDDLEALPELNRTVKFVMYVVSAVILTFFLIVGSCSMHSNTFDAERRHADAEYELARAEHTRANKEVQLEEVKTIERLINKGTDPIAARCAVKGWDSRDTTCARIAK